MSSSEIIGNFEIDRFGQSVFVRNSSGEWRQTSDDDYERVDPDLVRARKLEQVKMLCPGCKKMKSLAQYGAAPRSKTGRAAVCLPCERLTNYND